MIPSNSLSSAKIVSIAVFSTGKAEENYGMWRNFHRFMIGFTMPRV
jgi:hypothetical protein